MAWCGGGVCLVNKANIDGRYRGRIVYRRELNPGYNIHNTEAVGGNCSEYDNPSHARRIDAL